MTAGISHLIVDNTLTNDWELIPFFGLATCHQYNIHVIEIDP